MSYADVASVRCVSGEVAFEQVGDFVVGLLGDRGAHPALLDVAGDPAGAHHPSYALVVDPLLDRGIVVELGGDPGRAEGVVRVVNGPDPLGQSRIRRSAGGPGRCTCLPCVVGGTLDLDELTQSLHLEGGGVVGDELEATHQRVSPAKYLAAR